MLNERRGSARLGAALFVAGALVGVVVTVLLVQGYPAISAAIGPALPKSQDGWIKLAQLLGGFATLIAATAAVTAIIVATWAARKQAKVAGLVATLQQVNAFDEVWEGPKMRAERASLAKYAMTQEGQPDWSIVANFFEKLGCFVDIGGVDKRLTWHIYDGPTRVYWRQLKKDIFALREEEDDNTFYEEWHLLVKAFEKIDKAKGLKRKTREKLAAEDQRFLAGESEAVELAPKEVETHPRPTGEAAAVEAPPKAETSPRPTGEPAAVQDAPKAAETPAGPGERTG